jgi:hypothetical protein
LIIAFSAFQIVDFRSAISLQDAADWGTIVTGAATLGLFLAAIGAGIIAIRQLDAQRVIAERRRVYDHLEAFYDVSFLAMASEAEQLFRIFRDHRSDGIAKWQEMSAWKQARIQAVMNFYEEVASEYNADFLEKQAADLTLVYVAVTIYERAEVMIDWVRQTDPVYFEQWKRLYDRSSPILARRKQELSSSS